ISYVADRETEMRRVLGSAALGCGLHLTATGDRWTTTAYGDCTAGAAARTAPSPAVVTGSAAAVGPEPDELDPLVEELVGLGDHPARKQRLTQELISAPSEGDTAARITNGLQVIKALETNGRNDPSIVRFF